MPPLFPVVGPIIEGLAIMWEAIVEAFSGLVAKNIAQTIWNILRFILILALIIIVSFLKSITVDFFRNIFFYLKKTKTS